MLRAILSHHLGELEVHVLAHASGCFFTKFVDRTNDLRLHRTHRRERFGHCLGLEANN